jgi:hypothetical protein
MTKNEIKTLIQDISRSEAEDATIDLYYDEVVEELGKLPDPPIVEVNLYPYTAATSTYDYPTDTIEPLHLFFTGYHLMRVSKHSLEAYEQTWRDDTGSPKAWKTEHENSRKIRIYPIPDTTSTDLAIGATEPLGEHFPANSGAIIASDSRESSISDMLGLYIAFRVLYKEFIRPSDHQDIEWAMLHKQIAQVFYHMGVRRNEQGERGRNKQAEETSAV